MNRIVVPSALGLAYVALAVAGGCNGPSEESPPRNLAEGGVGTKKDGGTRDGGPACYDDTAAKTYPNTVAVAPQKGACTDADLASFTKACFGNGTTATCDQYAKDHPACMSCLYTGDAKDVNGKTILAALMPFGPDQVIPNADACAAVVLKNEAECGLSYVNETSCLLTSCDTCANSDFNDCINRSAEDICSKLIVDPASTCGKALTAGRTAVDNACGGATFDDTFAKVAAVLCQ